MNPFDEMMEKRKNKKSETAGNEVERKTSAPVAEKPVESPKNENKTDKGNITAVEQMIEKLLTAQQGFSQQIDGIVTSVKEMKEQQQFTNKANEERFRMLENQKRQFLRERQRRAMEDRENADIPERPVSPVRRNASDYEDEPSDDYEDGPATTSNSGDFDENDFEPADDNSSTTDEVDENDYEPADDSTETGSEEDGPPDMEDTDSEEDGGDEPTEEAGNDYEGDGEAEDAPNEEDNEDERVREAKRRAIEERKKAREARRSAVVEENNTDNFEEEEFLEQNKKKPQPSIDNGSVKVQDMNTDNKETEKWLKDDEADYTLQRMQALAANIKGTVTSATKMNDELRITLEEVRKENQNLTDIALRMEKILQNFLEIQSNSVELNDKVTRTVSYARDVFQKEYAETLAATSTSACSQFLSESRKKYEELFDKAVKNFKQFSDAAVSWQKEIESKSNKKLDRVSKVSLFSPFLLIIVIILQFYIILSKH